AWAVRALGLGDLGLDAAGAQRQSVAAGVIGAVAEQPPWLTARSPALAAHGRDLIDEADRLSDVVDVGGGQRDRERVALPAADQMVLGTAATPIHGTRPRFRAPPTARTCEDSIAARDQSIRSARRSFA